jgi:hypothetical protein
MQVNRLTDYQTHGWVTILDIKKTDQPLRQLYVNSNLGIRVTPDAGRVHSSSSISQLKPLYNRAEQPAVG